MVQHIEISLPVEPRRCCTAVLVLVLSVLGWLAPTASEAKQSRVYKVQGTIIAITLNQIPQLVVVKTPLGPRDHMTVGAIVNAQTKVFRGRKRVALTNLREGESVWLTYTKTKTGVLAQMIRVKG